MNDTDNIERAESPIDAYTEALREAIDRLNDDNARLIAAAAELLEVLKELAALDFGAQIMNDDDTRRIDFVARRARAAIAKAEGKP